MGFKFVDLCLGMGMGMCMPAKNVSLLSEMTLCFQK